MSDLLDPVGVDGRRRAYGRALGGPQDDDMTVPGSPSRRRQRGAQTAVNPLTGTASREARGAMFASALDQPFQGVTSLGRAAVAPPAAAAAVQAPGAGAGINLNAPGAAQRISTRVPTDVAAETRDAPHTRNDLEIGLAAAKQSPDAWAKNANLIRSYKHIRTEGLSDDQVHDAFVNHLTDNLVSLHDRIDPTIRASSKRWYDGARNIADRWAEEYQLQPHQVAGVLAALSPQKDWFQNVDLAKRLLDLHQRGGNIATDEGMQTRLQRYVDATKNADVKQALQEHVDAIGGKPLGQITDPMQRAMWMRAYDEVHNPRSYRVVTPEGDFGENAKTQKGANQKVAWGSFKEIHKAMQALADPSLENISRHMGGNHKVRNFYNNIIAPMAGRDATVDTHAIAAANMMPLGSNAELVKAGLGLKGASAAATGARGLYAHYIEAHRRAADTISNRPGGELTLPRELQSITWEGVRGTFTPEQKRDKQFVKRNADIWNAYGNGDIDAATARDRVLAHAAPQGIRDPKWHRSGVADDVE